MPRSIARETPGLEFPRGGLADVLQPSLMQRQLAAIESSCGRSSDARRRLTSIVRAESGDAGPLQVALAYEAAAALGQVDEDAWRPRLADALANASRTIESGTSGSPGSLHLAAGLLLRSLHREAEALREFREVFKSPDRNLSYYFARAALARGGERARQLAVGDCRLKIDGLSIDGCRSTFPNRHSVDRQSAPGNRH